jgi:ABC-type transport system involved in multi-copper enzyme maturation permease subunit
MTALRARIATIGMPPGIAAIVVKELRGRMRGRRAFIVVTIHVLLLAGLAWMLERLNEESIARIGNFSGGGFGVDSFGGQAATYASASIGRGIFSGLMLLQTLMVAVLAPAATAGAISGEREHQTLDLLAVTPISSLAIVVGKLLSALAWIFVLVLASVPVTALVFVFGGVAPDDMLRGYIVLIATVIGLGSIGIFFSALTRRTGASTGLTFVTTLVLVIGSLFMWFYLSNTGELTSTGLRRQPPEYLLYLNPFVAQTDVSCGTELGLGGSCNFISNILGATDPFSQPGFPTEPVPGVKPLFGGGGIDPGTNIPGQDFVGANGQVPPDVVVAAANSTDALRDRFWPKSVASFLLLAVVLTLASVQYVTPTRRWRPSLPGPVRRLIRTRSA